MAFWMATPIDEGFEAYCAGAQLCENRYPPNTGDAAKWEQGWQAAQQKVGDDK